MGKAVLSTKHCFVPPHGHTRMYAPGLHEAGSAVQCIYDAFRKGMGNAAVSEHKKSNACELLTTR